MKIVLTAHQFFPFSSGGTEVLVHQAAKELQHRGHAVTIVAAQPCPDQMPHTQRFDSYDFEGLHVERFHHSYSALQGQTVNTEIEYNNRFFYARFKQFLHDLKPDIVHAFHLHRLSASAVDAITELKIPALFTATDFWTICPASQLLLPDNSLCPGPSRNAANCIRHLTHDHPHGQQFQQQSDARIALTVSAQRLGLARKNWYTPHMLAIANRPAFLRKRLNRFQKILCPSLTLQNILIQNGVRPDRTLHQPYGVNVANITKHIGKGTHPNLRIAFLGQIAEHKGAHLLVEAFRLLPPNAPAELHFHGSTDPASDFHQRLLHAASADPRIHFHGRFDNSAISDILASIDLLVAPSLWYENTPLVIFEAFAAGVPALVSNLGGLAEAIRPNHNGLTFERGNVPHLHQRLADLIANRNLLAQLAANTRPPKSIPAYVTELETFYDEIAESPVRPQDA